MADIETLNIDWDHDEGPPACPKCGGPVERQDYSNFYCPECMIGW